MVLMNIRGPSEVARARSAILHSRRGTRSSPYGTPVVTGTAPTGTQAIDRAADLLVRLLASADARTLAELAAETGLPKSTASRLVRALERHDLVQRGPTRGSLQPGAVLVDYARRTAGVPDLVAVARGALQRLAAASGESVNLAVATPGGVEQIDQVDSRYLLGATNWVGLRVPYHASALGK